MAHLTRGAARAAALFLLATTLAAPDAAAQLPGQIVRDPDHPQWLVKHGTDEHPFYSSPGDPEDFLHRGTRLPDGTRDGDQDAILDRLIAEGGNALYVIACRSHGGDGAADENPFVNGDEAQGLDQDILDQWEGWFQRCEDNDILVYFFFYDDSTRVFSTGNGVFAEEIAFLSAVVDAFEHHPNLIWNVAEESEEAHSIFKVNNIADAIRAADDHDHIIGNHHHSGTNLVYFQDGRNLEHFSMHLNVPAADVHQGALDGRAGGVAAGTGGDGYFTMYTEATVTLTGSVTDRRRFLWDAAMGGTMPMLYGPDVINTPTATLNQCRIQQEFFEATDFWTTEPRDDLASGETKWVLARPPFSYIAYADSGSGSLGVTGTATGSYDLRWVDTVTGNTVVQEGVPVTGGSASFARPGGIGAECALWIRRAWKDLGFALAGSNGLPNLRVVSDMVDGEPFSLRLTNARPSTFVYNVVGFTFLGAPFYGGTFVPDLAFIVPGGTNASGVQVIETPFPPGFPSGASAFIQCWQEDPGAVFGFAGSNGVQGVAP